MTPVRAPAARLAVVTAIAGTVLIAALAFWLSFVALTNLAQRSGVAEGQAWAWPLIVDGLIVVATVAVVALDRKQAAWYPWVLLMAGTLVSVTANALHATVAADSDVPGVLAGCVAAVPPLVLLSSTHLTVVLVRSHRSAGDGRTGTADAPETGALEGPDEVTDPESADCERAVAVPASPGRRELAARLRAEGWSNKAIARQLSVAPSTIGRWLPRSDAAPKTTTATAAVTERREALGAPDWHDNPRDQEELTA